MEIPDDVAFTILSKLPLKSLKRFACAHKSWAPLFEDPHFMSTFRVNFLSKHHSYYDDTYLLLQHMRTNPAHHHTALYLLSGEEYENIVQLDRPPFQEDVRFKIILGYGIHGTFCLREGLNKFVLWNPATEEFRVIPPSPLESLPGLDVIITPLGFDYDTVREDFKLIRQLHYLPSFEDEANWQFEPMIPGENLLPRRVVSSPSWEIYSLRSNSWRKLDAYKMPIVGYGPTPNMDRMVPDVYMNGMCHWLGRTTAYGDETHLGSFNLSNEVFIRTPLPLYMGDIFVHKCLVVLNGSIAVISKYTETTTFHISILGELGVKESWTKLFIVGPLLGVELPIGAGKKGDIFFRKENGKLALFDLSTQMLKELFCQERLYSDRIIIYKESFHPIGRTEEEGEVSTINHNGDGSPCNILPSRRTRFLEAFTKVVRQLRRKIYKQEKCEH